MNLGQTVLYTAARQGNLEIISLLASVTKNSLDLNIQVQSHGGTPLHGEN
jgi:ankyrin repeat protein